MGSQTLSDTRADRATLLPMSRFLRMALVTVVVLAIAGPADAEVAAFDLQVTHEATATDHVVVMTETTTSASQIGPQTLNVFLRSDLDDQFRPLAGHTGIQVNLEKIDAQTARSVVALPMVGEWIVLPFADVDAPEFAPLQSADQYPIVSFAIPWSGSSTRIAAPSKSSSRWPLVAAVGGGAVVAGLIVLGLFRFLDHRGSSSAVVVRTDDTT